MTGTGDNEPLWTAQDVADIQSYRLVEEDVTFRLPVELRRELELASQT